LPFIFMITAFGYDQTPQIPKEQESPASKERSRLRRKKVMAPRLNCTSTISLPEYILTFILSLAKISERKCKQ